MLGLFQNLPLIYWLVVVFAFGAVVGSLLNVCIYRLPTEKSIIWPGSHCGLCFQPVRWYDNVPLVSYWVLRGRCRTCGAGFSARYFAVELVTAVAFTALFYFEVVENCLGIPAFENRFAVRWGAVAPWEAPQAWGVFLHHALLVSLLIVASVCDLDGRVIPLSLTMTGTLLGLVGATLFPWPWPNGHEVLDKLPLNQRWGAEPLPAGLYPWPFWGPLTWPEPGTWLFGLATGLTGAAVGTVMLRVVRFVFERALGREALGLGDADLMMMAGAFLGWQPVVIGFFFGAFAGLGLAIPLVAYRRLKYGDTDTALPYGPGLAVGTLLALFLWPRVNAEPGVRLLFFDAVQIGFVAVVGVVFMFVAGAVVGRLRPVES